MFIKMDSTDGTKEATGAASTSTGIPLVSTAGQCIDLPEIRHIKLHEVRVLKQADRNFSTWISQVDAQLSAFRLDRLTSSRCSRPTEDDPKYEAWRYYSLIVGGWLVMQVGENIHNTIVLRRQMLVQTDSEEDAPPLYADEIMDEIEKIMRAGDRIFQIQVDACKFHEYRRDQYDTARAYVEDMMKQYIILYNMDVVLPPIYVLVQILDELDDELPEARFISHKLSDKEAEFVDICRFTDYCNRLQFAGDRAEAQIRLTKVHIF